MSSRDDQHDTGGREIRVINPRRGQVTFQVIDINERNSQRIGQRLGKADPHKERSGQSRSIGHRNRVEI